MLHELTKPQFDALSELLFPFGQPAALAEDTIRELEQLGYLSHGRPTAAGREAMEPYRVRRAVFLAAGIEEIYLVRGYLAEQFDQLRYQYPMIRFLENPVYNETNNISSALCARHLLSNAYVLEADLVLHAPGLIQPYQYRSNFLAIPKQRTDDWCFEVEDGVITEEKIGGERCWQMVGISYWDRPDGEKLARDLKEVYEQPGGRERYWEQVPLTFRRENYRVSVRPCRDGDITEIDTFRELKAFDKSYDIG